MPWPSSAEYYEAVQLAGSFSDPELRQGEVAANALGLPRACTGNFADVYQIRCPKNQNWAVKCFTREVPGLQERYALISAHLESVRFPFTVEFRYFADGIRVRGRWYPLLKMRWVEGLPLNAFVRNHLDEPQMLQILAQMWPKLARQLRAGGIAHGDLQHGNILLVPNQDARSVRLTLIDYDGMIVPSLANKPSGEIGHPAFQHPERLRNGFSNLEVDGFSHLVICCGLQSLALAGRQLWDRYDNGDNLLFRNEDLAAPAASPLFRELWGLPSVPVHALVGNLILACKAPMAKVPSIFSLFPTEGTVAPLTAEQEREVEARLSRPQLAPHDGKANAWWKSVPTEIVQQLCGNCKKLMAVSAEQLGSGVPCPYCGWVAHRPTPKGLEDEAAMIMLSASTKAEEEIVSASPDGPEVPFECPFCGETYQVSDELVGKDINCRNCRARCQVEGGPVPVPEANTARGAAPLLGSNHTEMPRDNMEAFGIFFGQLIRTGIFILVILVIALSLIQLLR